MHENRIIYRDLKTDNILIFSINENDRFNAKIGDLGISRFADLSGLAMPTGTVGYRGPEMIIADADCMKSYGKSVGALPG